MTLKQALFSNGSCEDEKEYEAIIEDMVELVERGEDPEEVLYMHGLEPDYVFDLLNEMQ